MDVCVAHHIAELLEGYLSVLVLVGEEDSFVHDLLELRVFQIVADHHLEDLKSYRETKVNTKSLNGRLVFETGASSTTFLVTVTEVIPHEILDFSTTSNHLSSTHTIYGSPSEVFAISCEMRRFKKSPSGQCGLLLLVYKGDKVIDIIQWRTVRRFEYDFDHYIK